MPPTPDNFFLHTVDHHDLHSFPTRRSSDLITPELSPARRISRSSTSPASAGPSSAPSPNPSAPISRSEEHTSELQSPCNLVCRLLLETKNYCTKPSDFNYPLERRI